MLNHTSSQYHATRNDEIRGYLTLMLNFDFTHHQSFVRNGFSKSRNIPLSEHTREPFGKQNTSNPPASSWSKSSIYVWNPRRKRTSSWGLEYSGNQRGSRHSTIIHHYLTRHKGPTYCDWAGVTSKSATALNSLGCIFVRLNELDTHFENINFCINNIDST